MNRRPAGRRLGLVLTLLGLCAPASQAANLLLIPDSTTVALGDTVTLELVVSDLGASAAPALGTFDLELSYDPVTFALKDFVWGSGLGDLALSEAIGEWSDGGGALEIFELSLLTPAQLVDSQPGEMVLATMTFEAIGAGSGVLDVPRVRLGDENGAEFPVTVVPTEISTDEILDIPTLSHPWLSLLACLLAITGLAVLRRISS